MSFYLASYSHKPWAGVFAYLTSAATTTVTTGDEFTPVLGTFDNDPMYGFSLGTTELVCEIACWYEIDWHASFSSQDAGRVVHFGVSINDATLTTASDSVMGIFVKYAGECVAISGTEVTYLNVGDTVQLQLTSDTDADQVTVGHYTTTINRFYK